MLSKQDFTTKLSGSLHTAVGIDSNFKAEKSGLSVLSHKTTLVWSYLPIWEFRFAFFEVNNTQQGNEDYICFIYHL